MFNFNKTKIKNKFLIFFVLASLFFVLNINKSFACYDDDGYYYDCNTNQGVICSDGYTWAIDYNSCPTSGGGGGSGGVICSDGYTWAINYSSCPSISTPPTNNQGVICSDGYTWAINYSSCPSISTPSTPTNNQGIYCSDGYTWAIDYSHCPSTNTPSPYYPPSYNPPSYGYSQPSYNYPPAYSYGGSYGYGGTTYPTTYPTYPTTYPTYPTTPTQPQMIQCWNGSYVYNYTQCPAQTQPQPQTQTCPNGQIIPIGQACPAQTQTCWNGSVIPINQACPPQNQTCSNGQIIPVNQICPAQTHTCWNGIVLPLTQSCPSQYQTCWDGSVIPLTQACPIKTTTTVVVKQVTIVSHSVITDTPTKVSKTSAECNGVALISNNTQSVGWFEFGTTESLGKTTNSADIGNDSQSYFSNIISGLKPNTKYYCRAVMANRDGTYRGKIVSFKTLAETKTTVVYASPKKSVTVKPKTKTEFVCSDGSIAVAKTVSIGETLNSGGKLLSIKIERSSPDLVQGSTINYRISITNESDTAVTGAEAKITLPAELLFIDATTTGGVTVKDNIMTVPIGNINSKEVKTFILPAQVSPTAPVGKAVITTVYASYNLPVTGSKIVKDEVSAYMTANIVASGAGVSAKTKAPSLASMLFPQTLLGWLVLFAVILILVVLIMNIRRWLAERKLEKEETIHHHKS